MMQLFGPLYLFNAIITIVYYTYFHGATGQTPGKMVCKLRVVNIKGEPIGYPRAFLRWIGYIISSFVLCLGFLWVVWDKNKQGWHDKIARSYVISTKWFLILDSWCWILDKKGMNIEHPTSNIERRIKNKRFSLSPLGRGLRWGEFCYWFLAPADRFFTLEIFSLRPLRWWYLLLLFWLLTSFLNLQLIFQR